MSIVEAARRILAGRGKPVFDSMGAPKELYIRHLSERCEELYGIGEKLIAALEAAERRAEEAERLRKANFGMMEEAWNRIAALRAHLPALRAMGEDLLHVVEILRDKHFDSTADSLDKNRAAIAEIVRIVEGVG